jgi:beta-lactamase class C
MHRRIACGFGVALLASLGLGAGLATADERLSLTDDRLAAAVEDAASSVMRGYDIPGLSIAITDQGRQHFYNFGTASRQTGQPVSSDTLFEVGSISKTFTATLATWAQANGQLSLTARIDTYLTPLRDSRLGKLPAFHLATHTAGGFPLQVPEKIRNEQQLMAYFKAWQPQYLAGTHRSYANPSIGLLGMIAARSMKMPFEEAMEKQLFPALGLNDTWLNVPADRLQAYAQGYDKTGSPVRLNPGVLAAEAYGIKSSSRDLLRFVEAHLAAAATDTPLERALLDTRTGYFRTGAMTQDLVWEQYPQPVQLNALLSGNSSKMTLETQRVETLDPPLPAQDRVWINKTGSTNGFGAYIAFVPDRKLGIVVLANRNYPNEERVKLAWRVLSELGCCSTD